MQGAVRRSGGTPTHHRRHHTPHRRPLRPIVFRTSGAPAVLPQGPRAQACRQARAGEVGGQGAGRADGQRLPPRAEGRTDGEVPRGPAALPRHRPDAPSDSGGYGHHRDRPAQPPADMEPQADRGAPRVRVPRGGGRRPLPHEAVPEIHRREVCRRHSLPERDRTPHCGGGPGVRAASRDVPRVCAGA